MLWLLISNFIFPEKTNGHLVTRIFWTREKISNTQICYRVTVLNNLNKRDHKNYFWKDVSLTIVKFQLKISVILLTFLRKKASQVFFYLYSYICLCILFFFFFALFAFCSHDFAFKRSVSFVHLLKLWHKCVSKIPSAASEIFLVKLYYLCLFCSYSCAAVVIYLNRFSS